MLILCLSFFIALLDQVTKYLIRQKLLVGHITVIPDFFDICYVQNTGAAWGIMQGLNSWLVILSIVMLGLIIIFRKSILQDTLIHRIAIGLMIGGIVGNLVDRVRLGYVVDFLHFFWRNHHFPSFNVADSAICVGVALYVISQFFEKPSSSLSSQGSAEPAKIETESK
ncbi:MAG: signal peptidase II [Kiritimatiellae bacterium]|nr:signal peptidase II [Kiritimatiellia bacterium]MDD5522151.1 signal peptidase II [Kiritimatiellia bacterium]